MQKSLWRLLVCCCLLIGVLMIPSMAADSETVDYGILRYISRSTLDSLSGTGYASFFVSNGTMLGRGSNTNYTFHCAVTTPDRICHIALYRENAYIRVLGATTSNDPLTYTSCLIKNDSTLSRDPYNGNAVFTQYLNVYCFYIYTDWNVFPLNTSIYTIYDSKADAYEALANSFDEQPPDPGPGGGDLFVASVYNSSPIGIGTLADNVLGDSGFTWLNSSYDIEDSVYTPVAEIMAPSGYQVRPMRNNASAQYLCWADYSYSSADYASISVSGDFTFYLQSSADTIAGTTETRYLYPSSAVLAINGDPYYSAGGNLFSGGVYSVDTTIPLSDTGDIYSIGVWAFFDDTILDTTLYVAADVGFFATNNLVVTTTEYVAPVYPEDPTIGDVLPDLTGLQNGINQNNRQNNTIIQTLFNLPSNIANGIGNLFIPQHMTDYRDLYGNLLQDKLGFVWQAGTMVTDFSSSLVDTMTSDISPYQFVVGPISVPMDGQDYVILSQTSVDLNNDLMVVLRPILDTVVCLVCTLAFFNTCRDMMISLLSGASYMEYLGRREESIRDY